MEASLTCFLIDIPWPEPEDALDDNGEPIGECIAPDARNLITGLLSRCPTERLGVAATIEQHPFFRDVGPWSDLQRTEMPFVPCPDGEADTCYFEVR